MVVSKKVLEAVSVWCRKNGVVIQLANEVDEDTQYLRVLSKAVYRGVCGLTVVLTVAPESKPNPAEFAGAHEVFEAFGLTSLMKEVVIISEAEVQELLAMQHEGLVEVRDTKTGCVVKECSVRLGVELVVQQEVPVVYVTGIVGTSLCRSIKSVFEEWEVEWPMRNDWDSFQQSVDEFARGLARGLGMPMEVFEGQEEKQKEPKPQEESVSSILAETLRKLSLLPVSEERDRVYSTVAKIADTVKEDFWSVFLGMSLTDKQKEKLDKGWAAIAEYGKKNGSAKASEVYGLYKGMIKESLGE